MQLADQQKEDGAHPHIDRVGTVKAGQAEGDDSQQKKEKPFDASGDLRADRLQPTKLVPGGNRAGIAQQRRRMQAASVSLASPACWETSRDEKPGRGSGDRSSLAAD